MFRAPDEDGIGSRLIIWLAASFGHVWFKAAIESRCPVVSTANIQRAGHPFLGKGTCWISYWFTGMFLAS